MLDDSSLHGGLTERGGKLEDMMVKICPLGNPLNVLLLSSVHKLHMLVKQSLKFLGAVGSLVIILNLVNGQLIHELPLLNGINAHLLLESMLS